MKQSLSWERQVPRQLSQRHVLRPHLRLHHLHHLCRQPRPCLRGPWLRLHGQHLRRPHPLLRHHHQCTARHLLHVHSTKRKPLQKLEHLNSSRSLSPFQEAINTTKPLRSLAVTAAQDRPQAAGAPEPHPEAAVQQLLCPTFHQLPGVLSRHRLPHPCHTDADRPLRFSPYQPSVLLLYRLPCFSPRTQYS